MKLIWIISAEYESEYQIHLRFSDGTEGIVDLKDSLDMPIFKQLRDKEYFKQFRLNSWTLEWPNGADLSPEFLYKLVNSQNPVI